MSKLVLNCGSGTSVIAAMFNGGSWPLMLWGGAFSPCFEGCRPSTFLWSWRGGAVRISQELWSGHHWGWDYKRTLERVEEYDHQEGELDRLEKKWASRGILSSEELWLHLELGCRLGWYPPQWLSEWLGGCRDPTISNPREEDFLQPWRA
jgi:hypothetical protein